MRKIAMFVLLGAAVILMAASPIQFHNLLSSTHTDTVPYSPPVAGDLIAGNASGKWERVAPNTSTNRQFLSMVGDGVNGTVPTWNTVTLQQVFRYQCFAPGTSQLDAMDTLEAGTNQCTMATSPNVFSDYVHSNSFDSTLTITSGVLAHLRVEASGSSFAFAACGDDSDTFTVMDGDRVGAYYNTETGVVTIYVNTTSTTIHCNIPGILFPGVVASKVQATLLKQ